MFRKPYSLGPPGDKSKGRYCAFHEANGHETADCRHLKDQVEDLIRKGYLSEFVAEQAKKYKADKDGKGADLNNQARIKIGRAHV